MTHTVRDWMSSQVVVVDADSSVEFALTLMRRHKIHSAVVSISEKNSQYGIVTSTDIRDKIVGAGRKPAETTVREIMSAPIITAKPEWTLMECSDVMEKYHIHHLPVLDESAKLIGLISATDIFMAVEEAGWEDSVDDISGKQITQYSRYSRVEYKTPMDLGQKYLLRISLLTTRQAVHILPGGRIKWAMLNFESTEAEPEIVVIPNSEFFIVSPPKRIVQLMSKDDILTSFALIPQKIPELTRGRCYITLDFEYESRVIKSIQFPVVVQHKYQLGPFIIPHDQWRLIGGAGTVLSVSTVLSVCNSITELYAFVTGKFTFQSNVALFFFLGLLTGVGLIVFSMILHRQASKNEYKEIQ